MFRTLLTFLLLVLSLQAFASGDRADYDIDDDGLIEINDWQDLDAIRHHLDGKAFDEGLWVSRAILFIRNPPIH
jgi:hypothetical protein